MKPGSPHPLPRSRSRLTAIVSVAVSFAAGAAFAMSLSAHARPQKPTVDRVGPTASVTHLDKAPVRLSPSGTASIRVLARGKQAFMGVLTLNGGAGVPQHADGTEEYLYIIDGMGIITIDCTQHRLKPGATVFMPAGAKVSYRNGPTPLIALQVFAGPAPAAKYDRWKAVQ